ncbi:MAG: winged helix-turn-helix transcriptional regulator [Phycisphaeraceae bacterium]|nr:winged helix-turn-helix transcriptional regulator [Phycisphaeraceae bacterium]
MVTDQTKPVDHPAFRAISDPTRRAILDGLRDGPRTSGRIAASFLVSRPAVCKHLKILVNSGLVRVHKRGRERVYELEARPLEKVEGWLEQYRQFWASRLARLKDYLESEQTGADELKGNS